jgi:hypothetical protein
MGFIDPPMQRLQPTKGAFKSPEHDFRILRVCWCVGSSRGILVGAG